MRNHHDILVFFFLLMAGIGFAQPTYVITDSLFTSTLHPDHIQISHEQSPESTFPHDNTFEPIEKNNIDFSRPIHWMRFSLQNVRTDNIEEFKLAVAFADEATLFIPGEEGYEIRKSGDSYAFPDRDVSLGRIILLKTKIPTDTTLTCYLKVESWSGISQNFRNLTIKSVTLYDEKAFVNRFEDARKYHAFFYGAIVIMLLYNIFIYISLKNRSYFYYLIYLAMLLLFMASNNGYLLELFIPEYPLVDLRIRILAMPLLMIAYIHFGRHYLSLDTYMPALNKVLKGITLLFALLLVLMLCGVWQLARDIGIITAIACFVLLLIAAIIGQVKKYNAAKYFLIANILLILGAIFYAVPRMFEVVQQPFTEYAVQFSVIAQVGLFSIGLADRINQIRRQLTNEKLEREKLKLEKETERKLLIEEKNRELEEKVKQRTSQVTKQKEQLEDKNKLITDSISYAKYIQNALLGSTDEIRKYIHGDAFVLFLPKDIVSGDFYWFTSVKENGNLVKIIIAADCTGHGVPGAFMTVMGNTLLNQIVVNEKITDPAVILKKLDERIFEALGKNDQPVNDGMDITILKVDETKQQVTFSGANNPLIYVKDGEIKRQRGSRSSIGGSSITGKKKFVNHYYDVTPGDCYYIFSDGFQDQFGGPENKKYMSGLFRSFLHEICKLPVDQQYDRLYREFYDWKGRYNQTDDVLVIGLCF